MFIVGTLTGRSINELFRVYCIEEICKFIVYTEIKLKGQKAKEIREGSKIIYSGEITTRNRVGVTGEYK